MSLSLSLKWKLIIQREKRYVPFTLPSDCGWICSSMGESWKAESELPRPRDTPSQRCLINLFHFCRGEPYSKHKDLVAKEIFRSYMPTTDFILATATTGGPRSAGRGDWGSEERLTRSPEHLQQCPVRALCASHLADTCKWVKSTHPGFQQAHMGPQAITSYPCSTAKLWNFSGNCSLSAKQMIIPTAQCGVVWVCCWFFFVFFFFWCCVFWWDDI